MPRTLLSGKKRNRGPGFTAAQKIYTEVADSLDPISRANLCKNLRSRIHKDNSKYQSLKWSFLVFFFFIMYLSFFLRFYLFLERGREGGREGEKHPCGAAPYWEPGHETQVCAWVCPRYDWESNQQPFGSPASTQSTEPHHLEPSFFLVNLLGWHWSTKP